jgi:hypothetical protein
MVRNMTILNLPIIRMSVHSSFSDFVRVVTPSRPIEVISVPRRGIGDLWGKKEARATSFYLLLEDSFKKLSQRRVYVGMAGGGLGFEARYRDHRCLSWWDTVLLVSCPQRPLSRTEALYLEDRAIRAVRSTGIFKPENMIGGHGRSLKPWDMDCCEDLWNTAAHLLNSLNVPLHPREVYKASHTTSALVADQALSASSSSRSLSLRELEATPFFCKAGQAAATMFFRPSKKECIVMAGSKASCQKTGVLYPADEEIRNMVVTTCRNRGRPAGPK